MNKSMNGQRGRDQYDYMNIMREIEDVFQAATVPLILIGEAGRRVRKKESFEGLDTINIGIPKRHLSKYALSAFKQNFGEDWKEFERDGLKFKIEVINRKYKFFRHASPEVYYGAIYHLPNPFEDYWRIKQLVR